jgi:cell division protein FtsW
MLIMLEPDMGTTIVVSSICLFTYIGSGGPLKPLLFSAPIVGLIAASLIIISPYRADRLKTFFDTSHDPLGSSYQIRQALIGLGSGGMFGVGFGQSRQKYDFLPEVTTDSIFAVVGEELGLAGTFIVSVAFIGLTLTGFQISKLAQSKFSSLLSLAITCWLGIQAFINMSANIALLPFTGIPLPFISYGGTALLVNLTASGILVNISQSIRANTHG